MTTNLTQTEPPAVEPKPASESRTLHINKVWMLCSVIGAILPDLVGLAIELLGEPLIGNAVAEYIPLRHRALFAGLIVALARHNIVQRWRTTQPIEDDSVRD